MMEWSVELTAPTKTAIDIDGDWVDDLMDLAADADGIVSVARDGSLISTRFTIEADDVVTATTLAVETWSSWADKLGIPVAAPTWADVCTYDTLETRNNIPLYPDVIGVTEVAEIMGVSKQRASELTKRANFPQPIARLALGPVWPKRNIEAWNEANPRRGKSGRPRKDKDSPN
jgi:predicted DNA-binding transcriptional regulator AlpA